MEQQRLKWKRKNTSAEDDSDGDQSSSPNQFTEEATRLNGKPGEIKHRIEKNTHRPSCGLKLYLGNGRIKHSISFYRIMLTIIMYYLLQYYVYHYYVLCLAYYVLACYVYRIIFYSIMLYRIMFYRITCYVLPYYVGEASHPQGRREPFLLLPTQYWGNRAWVEAPRQDVAGVSALSCIQALLSFIRHHSDIFHRIIPKMQNQLENFTSKCSHMIFFSFLTAWLRLWRILVTETGKVKIDKTTITLLPASTCECERWWETEGGQ